MSGNPDEKLVQKNYKTLRAMLDGKKLKYDTDENRFLVSCSVLCNGQPVRFTYKFNIAIKTVGLYCPLSVVVPKERRNQFAIAVARANFNIADGCFHFDYVGGKLFFRMLSSYADNLLDKETYEYMLMISCRIIGDFTEKFLTASKQEMTTEEICKYFG